MVITVMLKNNADRLLTMEVMVILDYWCQLIDYKSGSSDLQNVQVDYTISVCLHVRVLTWYCVPFDHSAIMQWNECEWGFNMSGMGNRRLGSELKTFQLVINGGIF